jgi:hypothetical protein
VKVMGQFDLSRSARGTEPSAVAPGVRDFIALQAYPTSLKTQEFVHKAPYCSNLTPASGATALGSATRAFSIQTDPLLK